MKKVISLSIALFFMLNMLTGMTLISAADYNVGARLNSVCYSPQLDLYVAVGNKGTILTSVNGKQWAKSQAPTEVADKNIGSYYSRVYASPDAVIWNNDKQIFVIAADDYILTSVDGLSWNVIPSPVISSAAIMLKSLHWDGERYYGLNGASGVFFRTNGEDLSDLTHWEKVSYTAPPTYEKTDGTTFWGNNPITSMTSFKRIENGKAVKYLFAMSSATRSYPMYSTNSGTTWGFVTSTATSHIGIPFDIEYLPEIDKILMAGIDGTSTAVTSAAAIGLIDDIPSLSKTTRLTMNGTGNATAGGWKKLLVDGTDVFAADVSGNVWKFSDYKTNNIFNKNSGGWTKLSVSNGSITNTTGFLSICKGKNGFVAVGGDAIITNNNQGSTALAVFIPLNEDKYPQIEMASFIDPSDSSALVASNIYISGQNEIGITDTAITADYTATVRDQGGNAVETVNPLAWSIEGNPAGVSINNGILTVLPNASAGVIKIKVEDAVNPAVYGTKTVVLTPPPVPTTIAITGFDRVVKRLQGTKDYYFSAVVYDAIEKPVESIQGVAWTLEGDNVEGISIASEDNRTGKLTVADNAAEGEYTITATSTIDNTVFLSKTVKVVKVNSVKITPPTYKYLHAGYTDKNTGASTDRTYIFTVKSFDTDNVEITDDTVTWDIAESSNIQGVTLTKLPTTGSLVLTSSAQSDQFTLRATSVINPEVSGEYVVEVVNSMVKNSTLKDGINGWTQQGDSGVTMERGTSGILNFLRVIANSQGAMGKWTADPVEIEGGALYNFTMQTKILGANPTPTENSSAWLEYSFLDVNGDEVGFNVLYDDQVYVNDTKKGHATSLDFSRIAQAPEDAVSVVISLNAVGPIQADFYDIGLTPIAANSVEITGKPQTITAPGVNSQLAASAKLENFKYAEDILLPDVITTIPSANPVGGVRWQLMENYLGVNIDPKTGVITTTGLAQNGVIKVKAFAYGNSRVSTETIEINVQNTLPQGVYSTEIKTGTIASGKPLTANATLVNTSADEKNATMILSVYEGNLLKFIDINSGIKIAGNSNQEASVAIDIPTGLNISGLTVKAFIWEDLTSLKNVPIIK